MEISPLRSEELQMFIDELWVPAQREMTAVSEYALLEDIREDGLSYRRSRLSEDETITYLVRVEEQLTGYVTAELETPPPIFEQRRECHVTELYVCEDARRQGIGTALLDRIEDWAADADCWRVSLNVHADNNSARALYEREGYELRRHNLKKSIRSEE